MLDPVISETIREVLLAEVTKRRRDLRRDLDNIHAQMSARGVGMGTPVLHAAADRCESELTVRAENIWTVVFDTVSAMVGQIDESLGTDVCSEMRRRIGDQVTDLTTTLQQDCKNVAARLNGGTGFLQHRSDDIAGIGLQLIDKYCAKARVFAASLAKARSVAGQTGSNIHVTIEGHNYGVLQTGDNASATVHTTIDSHALEAVKQALDVLSQHLEQSPTIPEYVAVADIVSELRVEVDTTRPNRIRIGGLLLGLGTTIQAIASLVPAYNFVRLAAAHFGYTLPALPTR